ncbi:MAG: class I SAM-dependent methyltransferase [Deltaproteobacteria bacterium]|nr:class I SAM-dependent methyltransferase [Deltaproteobacteria bacterium]
MNWERGNLVDNLNTIADFFDTVYPFTDDLEFWIDVIKQLFPNKGTSDIDILELGSGTGRVTIYLAKRGYTINGLEISERMKEICLSKLKDFPDDVWNRVTIHQGDMRDFKLSQKFDLIICPFNTFPMLLSKEERENALRSTHEHLKEGGVFIFDIWQHNLTTLNPGWNLWDYETGQKFYPVLGRSLSWCEYSTIEREQAIELIEISFTRVEDSETTTFSGKFYLKLFTKEELEQELIDNSFRVEMIYGDYQGRHWTEDSPIINFVARKA